MRKLNLINVNNRFGLLILLICIIINTIVNEKSHYSFNSNINFVSFLSDYQDKKKHSMYFICQGTNILDSLAANYEDFFAV